MNHLPLVSVIMPVYNTEKYVSAALESVLGQTYGNLEIICCDDGSTDGSRAILDDYAARYPSQVVVVGDGTNHGIAAARNLAIAAARGEFFASMDADDLWKPEKLSVQMDQFLHDPNLDISFTWMQCFISPDIPEDIKQLRSCPPDPSPGYISATAMVKRTSFDRVGLFDPKWRVGEFIDWYARAQDIPLTSAIVNQVMFLRRIHETNTGVVERSSRSDYLKIMRAALARKRSGHEPNPS